MTPENLKELIPPPPPPHKKNLLKLILIIAVVGIVVIAATVAGSFMLAGLGASVEATSEVAAELGAAEDVMATSEEGSAYFSAAEDWSEEAMADTSNIKSFDMYTRNMNHWYTLNPNTAGKILSTYYQRLADPNVQQMLANLYRVNPVEKRGMTPTDNIGFFTVNMMNVCFLPSLMDDVHQSFTGSGQTYADISSYLSAASEHLQFHFENTLHNNFFAANKSLLASFTVNQRTDYHKLLDNDDDVYDTIKQNTYYFMAASIISGTLRKLNVEICDPKPLFCGQPCDSGHIYCPIVGNDTNSCVISATDKQIKELNFLRDPFDICSTDNRTGWDITHNSNCNNRTQFQCK